MSIRLILDQASILGIRPPAIIHMIRCVNSLPASYLICLLETKKAGGKIPSAQRGTAKLFWHNKKSFFQRDRPAVQRLPHDHSFHAFFHQR